MLPPAVVLQSVSGLSAELKALHSQPSPLAAAQAAKQEVLADQRKFHEVIAGNQVGPFLILVCWFVVGPFHVSSRLLASCLPCTRADHVLLHAV